MTASMTVRPVGRFARIGSAAAVLAVAGVARAQNVSGAITWQDEAGVAHAARHIDVQLMGQVLIGGVPFTVPVGTGVTDGQGNYSINMLPVPGLTSVSVRALARNPGGFVSTDTTIANTYSVQAAAPLAGGVVNVAIGNTTDARRAFSVADSVYTGYYWASLARTGGAPAQVKVVFPETGGGTASFYDPTDDSMHIRSWRRYAWDVINHEYGHYLADIDSLDQNPGGAHSFGVSSIPTLGKLDGIRLAWGEGLATFNGIASHNINQVAQNLPTTMATVGDRVYTSLNSDNPGATFAVDIEGMAGSANAGEGDEASVARILWDIADPKNEAHDRVERGLVNTYRDLQSIGSLDRLDDVWDFYYTQAGNDKTRTDYGAIFEQYEVSPHPHDGPIGQALAMTDPAPEFEWDRQNNGDSDVFGLIVWDSAFATRLLDIAIPGNVEAYTLTPAQWATLTTAAAGGPINLNFVIHGSDATSPGGFAYGPALVTGQYWSDAYRFTLIPAPATLAALGIPVVFGLRRRRR